ncbi:MAG: AI-2E family transporter [Betaproteobacteria bacterium HGW-Betaproteobacteria-22]|nr:MAG: AI-2E family transporter [Betaproteobacteria bacterium HGW-Betaproteobacteria-22]
MINTNKIARIALITLLIIGCVLVLYPFMAAVLFSAVICVFTWPLYHRIWLKLGRRDVLAAVIMTLLLLFSLILPMAYLAASFAGSATLLFDEVQMALRSLQPDAPAWIRNFPIIGGQLADTWKLVAINQGELARLLGQYAEPIRNFLLGAVQVVAGGFLQLLLVVFVAFFLYRDGRWLAQSVVAMAHRVGGSFGEEMLRLSCNTAKGVMLGIFGTAIAQATVALMGFLIAGVPMPLLLALATFFLSVVPVGPPLIWGGAAFWLFNHGQHGWAVFIAVYGLLVISSVDNIIKPLLISHSSRLPLLLVVLGVLGGLLAFGFIGIFLGPTLLAVGVTLITHWVVLQNKKADEVV